MPKSDDIQAEVDQNFEAFQRLLPELLTTDAGKYVLLRHAEVVRAFDSPGDALIYGEDTYPDALFSIQLVTSEAVDLGYFSHAVSLAII